MQHEKQLADFTLNLKYNEIAPDAIATIKKVLLTVCGTAVGGAKTDGIAELDGFWGELAGKPEATVMFYGTRLPAHAAAMINAAMARALDYCDSINPGPHFGASLLGVGLALTELRGGVSGKELLTAWAVGQEVGSRFNLPEEAYGGVDPTGIAGAFAATAMACRLLKLTREQAINAYGIALNNASGSFQSHIDGTLSVRLNQGMLAHDAVLAARFAQIGLTGPQNFLGGVYGYCNVQGRGLIEPDYITDGLGQSWKLTKTVFKKFPSCFMTSAPTEATLQLMSETGLKPQDIAAVTLKIQPFGYNLVGGPFKVGPNPKVDAQFNVTYCIANAILRGKSCLAYFEPEYIKAPEIMDFTKKITVVSDGEIYKRGHSAVELTIVDQAGREYTKQLDNAPGTPYNPLNDADHLLHFDDCLAFGNMRKVTQKRDSIIKTINNLEKENNTLCLLELLNG